ncbi:integrase core domain protein [Mycobacterium xenopi 3993]|nr:integrase core domain protein [Mycobacterium xenopi 3993]
MDSEADGHHCTSGMNPWRARCGEIRSAGSEGGPGKRIGRNADTAPRSDPYTYLSTGEGWLYLCAVRDGCSRKVIGWAIDDYLHTDLVQAAVEMAVAMRGELAEQVVLHADRGCQYTSAQLARFAREHNLARSVGRTAVCWDNAQQESFWATLKVEFYDRHLWPTKAAAKLAVGDWIERVYNRRRRHSALAMMRGHVPWSGVRAVACPRVALW